MKPAVKVLFASGSEDLIPTAIEHLKGIYPEIPVEVVSEFPPPEGRWTPYRVNRTFLENLSYLRARFRGKHIRLAAVILQPRMPYWRLRLLALALSPWNFLAFNEAFGHFMLRPRSFGTIARHLLWRTRNFFVWEFSPGGAIHTFLWRLWHPWAFARPIMVWVARGAGLLTALLNAIGSRLAGSPKPAIEERIAGISVVIPSRNGKDLLARLLPELMRQNPSEVIVVDNGSDDGSEEFLAERYPSVVIESSIRPMSFARAVNAGIAISRFSYICLLNNDMVVEPGFLDALLAAFDAAPDLFCATAQIFFPEGERRQETGKAVMPGSRPAADFPVTCELPHEGEDLSYVLYGSGGCSMFDARKLLSLEAFDEIFDPAYVEDLDLGVRGWERGWPSVFVAAARVLHLHRSTTSRYFTRRQLDRILEINHLRFIARTISGWNNQWRHWRRAIRRVNLLAARQNPDRAARAALYRAWRAPFWSQRRARDPAAISHALALTSGDVCVRPGQRPTGRPVVLIATPYLPFPLAHGGAVRMFNLMRRAARDFDQVLVSFVSEEADIAQELREICVEVVTVRHVGTHLVAGKRPDVVEDFDRPAFHAALRQTIRKWKPAVAQLEFTQMAQYAADCAPALTVLVEHDITFDLYEQLLSQGEDWEVRFQLERWKRFEKAAWKDVSRVVVMSRKDQGTCPGSVCLPNGVDLQRFQPTGQAPEGGGVLFIGSFAHLPNVLAIDYFLRECWPRLSESGATLHVIAGSRPEYFLERYRERVRPHLAQPNIELEGFVADVRPAYGRASVVVAPLLVSAGTNIKIMEAMAMGKAIVSTPAGINGLDLTPGVDVIVVQDGAEMAEAISDLMRNPVRRQAIESRARETAERVFDWDVVAREQEGMYRELMESSRLKSGCGQD